MLLRVGAEAELTLAEWRGRQVVVKRRLPKTYRDASLDAALRVQRMRTELKLMAEARGCGLSVPILYDVDVDEVTFTMEFVDGPRVKDLLETLEDPRDLCAEVGRLAGVLHAHDLVHGDLTTSNMLWRDPRVYLIDFSLGEKTAEVEAKGVDLHLLWEAFRSAHARAKEMLGWVWEGYAEAYPEAEAVRRKMMDIEKRGRYT